MAIILKNRPSLPIKVTLVGGGPMEHALRRQVSLLNLDSVVDFPGPMLPEEIAHVLCEFDVLVLPSRTTPTWKEQLGRVLIEAMASGVPVVGSNSGAIPEVIGDAGLIFPEGDQDALAERLVTLALDESLRLRLRERGFLQCMKYGNAELARRTVFLYREVSPVAT